MVGWEKLGVKIPYLIVWLGLGTIVSVDEGEGIETLGKFVGFIEDTGEIPQ